VGLSFDHYDWRRLVIADWRGRLEVGLRADRQRLFQAHQAPLIRLAFVRLSETAYFLICSYHPLVLDDESLARVFGEVLALYGAEPSRHTALLPTPVSFGQYAQWTRRQDPAEAERHWREELREITAPTPSPLPRQDPGAREGGEGRREECVRLPAELGTELAALAERLHVSVETLIRAAWALLLSKQCGAVDVVFGVVVSGWPDAIGSGRSMMGPLRSVVPVRVHMDPGQSVAEWLRQLHSRLADLWRFAYLSRARVRACGAIPPGVPLFESLVSTEPPVEAAGPAGSTDRPLRVRVECPAPRPESAPVEVSFAAGPRELQVRLAYPAGAAAAGSGLLTELRGWLAALVRDPECRLGDIRTPGTREHSPLVQFHERSAGLPFFCVHPAGGGVACYAALARRLGRDCPLVAIEAEPITAGSALPNARVEDLADRYVQILRASQPDGPYRLGGWSFGGLVAYAMACRLVGQGQTVALLAILDAAASAEQAAKPIRPRQALLRFARQLGVEKVGASAARLPPVELVRLLLREAKAAGLVPAEAEPKHFLRQVAAFRAHVAAGRAYVPPPYPGRVTVFRASETAARPSVQLGWERVAAAVEVHVIPGRHETMLREPHVQALASGLQGCVDALAARAG
jgi:thioesterase domain-containing protein